MVVRKIILSFVEDVALRSSIFFFYLIFHRSNTKKLTATRTRTTTIKVASSFTVVRYVLSNEDALCLCGTGTQKILFLKIFIYFFWIRWQKDLIIFQSFCFSVQLSSSQKCQVSHCSRKSCTHNKGDDGGYKTTNRQ